MVEQSAPISQRERVQVELFGSRDLSIERDVWIDYAVATETLMHLQWLIDHPPSHRPPCCLIVGDTNNGKTSIARYFAGKHAKRVAPDPQEPEHPVVYIQAPPGPNLSILYLKWSGKIGQRAKVYPTRMNGYENDEATELFRQV